MRSFKKTSLSFFVSVATLLSVVLGCGGGGSNSSQSSPAVNRSTNNDSVAGPTATPIAVQARDLTKAYEENELAADGKFKDKLLAVTGKISSIAETFGNVTVQLDGHKPLNTVMCSFEDDQKANVAMLKKGQSVTLVGTGDGSTGGLYVGLEKCSVKK